MCAFIVAWSSSLSSPSRLLWLLLSDLVCYYCCVVYCGDAAAAMLSRGCCGAVSAKTLLLDQREVDTVDVVRTVFLSTFAPPACLLENV